MDNLDSVVNCRQRLFVRTLLFFMPISSFLVFPAIQGTTVAYLLCYMVLVPGLGLLAVGWNGYRDLIKLFFLVIAVFVFVLLCSQFFISLFGVNSFYGLRLVNPFDYRDLMRSSMITQSLYVVPVVVTFFSIYLFYDKSDEKYLLAGGGFIVCYALYEELVWLVAATNGDFISNRTFGGGYYSGSLFQTMSIAGIRFMRVKSLTGEPSMFALTVLPYMIYFFDKKKYLFFCGALLSLFLTFSTTAYLGLLLFFVFAFWSGAFSRHPLLFLNVVFTFLVFAITFAATKFGVDVWQKLIYSKVLSANSQSALERSTWFYESLSYYVDSPLYVKLFGIGFGNVRSTDYFSTLLVNNGVVGLVVFSGIFLYPFFRLIKAGSYINASCVIVLYLALMISVPEFSDLTTWAFLALFYKAGLNGRVE